MKLAPVYLALAAFLSAGPSALAGVGVSATPMVANATLDAAGWQGWLITLTATAGDTIAVVDFAEAPLPSSPFPIGISGPLHQSWIIDNGTNAPVGPALLTPTLFSTLTTAPAQAARTDSVFLNRNYYSLFVFPSNSFENNNRANGPSPTPLPYNTSPLADVPGTLGTTGDDYVNGTDYGVGSLMTMQGASVSAGSVNSLNVAFILLPKTLGLFSDTPPQAAIRGAIYTFNNPNDAIPFEFYFAPVPEPASLSLFVLGGMALLSRRRRNA